MLQQAFAAFGKVVAKKPLPIWLGSFLVCLLLQIGWFPDVREAFGIDLGKGIARSLSDKDFEELWSTNEGNVGETVRKWKSLRNRDWEYSMQITMFVGKGPLKGKDILTPEVFDEVRPLLKKFHALSVLTTGGNNYTTWDLCARGSTPDIGGMPYMPCMMSSPQACFSEYFDDALHPSYKAIDPFIGKVLPPSVFAKSWTGPKGRPSYRSLKAQGMKNEVSRMRPLTGQRGCSGYTEMVTYTPDVWGGKVSWNANKTQVEKVPAFMWTLFLDGPARAAFRMGLTKPEHADFGQVSEAIDLLEDQWQREVDSFSRTSQLVEVVNMQWPSTFEEIEEQYEDYPYGQVVLGYVLMTVFIILCLLRFHHPLRSRWLVGVAGLVAVGMASSAAVCLFLLFGWKINAVMMVVLPFFGLGLGVNDMFVFVRHFSEQVVKADVNQGSSDGTPAPQRNAEDITCAMLAGAGPGAMLTSTCNCVTFTFGALIMPVPALADFCAAAALVVALNYFVMLTQVVPLLSWAASRAVMSPQACACTSSCDNVEAQCFQSWTAGVSKLEKKIAKMTSLSFGCLTFSLWPCALILLVVSGVLINDKDIGYTEFRGSMLYFNVVFSL